MDQKTIADTHTTHHGKVEKNDLNRYDLMHGGRLLTICDEVGHIAAMKHAGADCLTRAAHDIQFLSMLKIGDPYTVDARVILTGRTTLWVTTIVKSGEKSVMKAVFVYITVDSAFKPTPVPEITARSPEEKQEQVMMKQLIRQVKT